MVSLENKYQYIGHVKANTSLAPIIDFIFQKKVLLSESADLNNPQNVTISLIKTIIDEDEQSFLVYYHAYKKKVPDDRSPWINNNYLLFFFLIASLKFKQDTDWLKVAISKRRKGLNEEEDIICDFFYNVAQGNFKGEGKYAPLNLCLKYLLNPTTIEDEDVHGALRELNSFSKFPFYENEFLNILCLKSFDLTLEMKDVKNLKNEERLEKFEAIFLKRINLLSGIAVYAVLFGIIFLAYHILMQANEQKRNLVITFLSLAGVTVLEILKLRSILTKTINKFLYDFFGYVKSK